MVDLLNWPSFLALRPKLAPVIILGPLYIRAHPLGPFPKSGHQPMRVLRLPTFGPKGFILGVGPCGLKLTWRVTWRRFGGKLMGLRQFYGSRVYADPSISLGPKVGFTQLPSFGASKRSLLCGVVWIN